MARIVIIIEDMQNNLVSVAVQSVNSDEKETPASRAAGDVLAMLCGSISGLEEALLKSKEGAIH